MTQPHLSTGSWRSSRTPPLSLPHVNTPKTLTALHRAATASGVGSSDRTCHLSRTLDNLWSYSFPVSGASGSAVSHPNRSAPPRSSRADLRLLGLPRHRPKPQVGRAEPRPEKGPRATSAAKRRERAGSRRGCPSAVDEQREGASSPSPMREGALSRRALLSRRWGSDE